MLLIQDTNASWASAPQDLSYPPLFDVYNRAFSFFRRRLTYGMHLAIFQQINNAQPGRVFRSHELVTRCLERWELAEECAAFCQPATIAHLFHQVIWVYFFIHEKRFLAHSLDEAGQKYPVAEPSFPDHFVRRRWLFEPEDDSAWPDTVGLPRELEANVEVVARGYNLGTYLPDGTRGWVISTNPADGYVKIRLESGSFPYQLDVPWYFLRVV